MKSSVVCPMLSTLGTENYLLPSRVKTTPVIEKNFYRLIEGWQSNTIIQIEHELSRLTLDILGDCVFGYNFNCIENPGNELTAALYRLMSVQDMNILRYSFY